MEYLAIVEGITSKFYKYIINSHTIIFTDNYPVVHNFAASFENDSNKILRWKLKLTPFSLKIAHIKGKMNLTQDFLSRIFEIDEKGIIIKSESQNTHEICPKIAVFTILENALNNYKSIKKQNLRDI